MKNKWKIKMLDFKLSSPTKVGSHREPPGTTKISFIHSSIYFHKSDLKFKNKRCCM